MMDEREFDKFAQEYRELHTRNIRLSGEAPEFFARYKVNDLALLLGARAKDALNILDFGAGTGSSVAPMRELLPRSRLTCLDVSRKSLEIGRLNHPGQADFVAFNGQEIPFPEGTFDVAFAACVFHHIEASQHVAVLAELRRALKPGGHVVIFEHNPFNPLTRRAVDTCPFDENAVLIPARTLIDRMTTAGFSRVYHRYRVFFPGPLRSLRFMEPWLTWLPLGAQYFSVGRK